MKCSICSVFLAFCSPPDVQRKRDGVTEHVTEDMLKEVVHVSISETDNMSLLDIPSTYVSVDADDAEAIMWVNLFNCLTISELFVRYMGEYSGHLVFTERETIIMLRCAGTERAMTRTWIDQCRH